MIKTIIIDDEPDARENIASMIGAYANNIALVAEADSVQSGAEAIKKHQPDLVFLDIKMPDGTGFDLLQKLDKIDFKIIFITAYEEYAIKAFKFSALDYLLKPIDPDELIGAIENTGEAIEKENIALKMDAFIENAGNPFGRRKKLVLKTIESIYVKSLEDIISFKSDGSYTEVNLSEGKKIVVSRPLKEYDNLLSGYGFLRTHKSHLINLEHFDRFNKGDGGYVLMKDGSSIPVSQRKKEQLLKILNEF